MTIAEPRSPPPGGSDQPPAGPDRPLLRAVIPADDGRVGTGSGSTAVDTFVVDWQLVDVAGVRL